MHSVYSDFSAGSFNGIAIEPLDSNADIVPENQHSHGYVIDASSHVTNNCPVTELSLNLVAFIDITADLSKLLWPSKV